MGTLTLTTLGPLEVRHDGAVLTFRTRKTVALLLYLAVEAGLHSREKLAALFWPESDPVHGRAMLRRTLAFLRAGLGDDTVPPAQAHLLVERLGLAFNRRAAFRLDLDQLNLAPRAGRDEWQAAVNAYQGDFLADFLLGDAPEFDTWAARRREAAHVGVTALLDRLSQWQIEAGATDEAKGNLTRWLALDPLNETAAARLIRLHLAAGERQAAQRVYEACRAGLARELGVTPSAEILALAERIRRDVPVRAGGGGARPGPGGPPMLSLQAPLIGRGPEFVKLVERYHLAHRGRLQVVVVTGEAGIGKTRLVREFLTWAAAHDGDVLSGQTLETGGRIPYQPLVEALRRRLEQENAPEDLVSDVWLVELSRLLPELRERYPDLPPAGDETAARTRLFEAVARLGAAWAGRTPLVLFLDDLQWADAASLDLLHYALRRWAEEARRIMVVLTRRAEALPDSPGLTAWLAAVGRDLPLTSLALTPLTREDTLRWVRALTPARDRPAAAQESADPTLAAFGAWLFEQTGGQPFYITETFKALLEQGVLTASFAPEQGWLVRFLPGPGDPADWQHLIPAGVRDLVRSQVERLGPPPRALLAAGAVLGHDFTFEQLCAVADLSEPEALAALDAVLHSGMWREVIRSEVDAFAFAHDTIRAVVYDEVGAPRRRIFHQRALAARQREGARPAELARHALAAGLNEPAFRFSLEAGEAAVQVFAMRDAIGYYEQAHTLAGPVPGAALGRTGPAAEEVYRLLTGLGRAYEFLNQWPEAEGVYSELLALARDRHAPEAACLALNRLAAVAYQGSFDLQRAGGLLQQALALTAQGVSKAVQAETDWNLAQLNFYIWHLEDARAFAGRARSLAAELGQRELAARCLNTIAFSEMMLGYDWRQVAEEAAEARTLFAALGNRALEADALSMIAIIHVQGGRFDIGMAAARTGVALARAAENPWGEANCSWSLARALLERGDLLAALAAAQAGVAAARAARHPPSLVFNLAVLGRIYRTLGDRGAAHAAHSEAWQIAGALPPHPLVTEWAAAELCADHVLAGEWAAAYGYVEQIQRVRDYHTVYAGPGRYYETMTLVRAGEAEAAAADLARFGQQLDHLGYADRYRTDYLRGCAVLAEAEGALDRALGHLQQAVALAADLGLALAEWAAWHEIARLQRAGGQEAAAHEAQGRAAHLTQALAARIEDPHWRTMFLAQA